jgi:hypothetical protein
VRPLNLRKPPSRSRLSLYTASEIADVIKDLCTGSLETQQNTLRHYFLHDAGFSHPFCLVLRGPNSRFYIASIYKWYKILSPHIDIEVHSTAFDEKNGKLFAIGSQKFSMFMVPWSSVITLTIVLTLEKQSVVAEDGTPGKELYYIAKQEDHYQMDQTIKILVPFLAVLWDVWRRFSTFVCLLGVIICLPILRILSSAIPSNPWEREGVTWSPPSRGSNTEEESGVEEIAMTMLKPGTRKRKNRHHKHGLNGH